MLVELGSPLVQFLEQKYGYYHCKDCNIRWESAYVWCVQGTNKVRTRADIFWTKGSGGFCFKFSLSPIPGLLQAVLQNLSEVLQPLPSGGHHLSSKSNVCILCLNWGAREGLQAVS